VAACEKHYGHQTANGFRLGVALRLSGVAIMFSIKRHQMARLAQVNDGSAYGIMHGVLLPAKA